MSAVGRGERGDDAAERRGHAPRPAAAEPPLHRKLGLRVADRLPRLVELRLGCQPLGEQALRMRQLLAGQGQRRQRLLIGQYFRRLGAVIEQRAAGLDALSRDDAQAQDLACLCGMPMSSVVPVAA